jgi:hypothetical protein
MNMFAAATTVTTKKPAKATKKAETVSVPGMLAYASVCAAITALGGLKATLEGRVKGTMLDHFIKVGMERKSRPDNFEGTEGVATASCQLKVRGGNSPLKPEEVEILNKHDIPVTLIDEVEECFIINPAYKDDQKLLEQVSKALQGVKGLPADFIMKQEQKKAVANEDAMNAVFKLADADLVRDLMPLVAIPSVRPTLEGETAVTDAFVLINSLVPSMAAAAKAAAAAEAAAKADKKGKK